MQARWTFDRFEPGQRLGTHREALGPADLEDWFAIHPGDRDFLPRMPPGLALALVMRAYMRVLGDRPPGNIHAGQDLDILRLPGAADPLTTTLTCAETSLAGGRRRVAFDTVTTGDDGGCVFRSRIAMIWAG